jgi:hypothetical protein
MPFYGLYNLTVDFLYRYSLSTGGPPTSPLRLRGLPWTRFSKQASRIFRSTFVLTFRTLLPIKHDSIQRNQLEMITYKEGYREYKSPKHICPTSSSLSQCTKRISKSGDTAYLANISGRGRSSASSFRCKNYICET